MNWVFLLIALIFSVSVAASVHGLLVRRRPHWSARRHTLAAAFALPALLVLLTLLGIAWELVRAPGPGENMQDLAIAALIFLGTLFALIATAGGFIGAKLDRRRRSR